MIQNNQTHRRRLRRRPSGSVCLIILYHKYLWIYQLYIPYIFHIYFLDMFHCHPCIFPCVFLNLWSQEKTSPYCKTTFLSFLEILHLLYLYQQVFDFLLKLMFFKQNWAHMGPNPDRAPTRFFFTFGRLWVQTLPFCRMMMSLAPFDPNMSQNVLNSQ